jgi:hypothetical protein
MRPAARVCARYSQRFRATCRRMAMRSSPKSLLRTTMVSARSCEARMPRVWVRWARKLIASANSSKARSAA